MANFISATGPLHNLSTSFVLAYHGCDSATAEKLLRNRAFRLSQNVYDWLGEGIYFWEANPLRGLEFAKEPAKCNPEQVRKPTFVGAVIDLGFCVDLTTSLGLETTRTAYEELQRVSRQAGMPLPENRSDGMRNDLDCAVLNFVHRLRVEHGKQAFDTVKGIFVKRPALYPGSTFGVKNHIQIAVRNQQCIKGVFRVPGTHLEPSS